MDEQDPITELRQLLVISHQEQLNISRALLAAQKAHTEAVEASLRKNRILLLAMALLLAIVGGLNIYALWPRAVAIHRVIINGEGIPAVEQKQEVPGRQA